MPPPRTHTPAQSGCHVRALRVLALDAFMHAHPVTEGAGLAYSQCLRYDGRRPTRACTVMS